MITLKKIKNIIREQNFASYGGIRGLGAVTGEAGGGVTGTNTNWINQNIQGSQENTDNHQQLYQWHADLHDEIEDNDLNPKDKGKKILKDKGKKILNKQET
jgi:hypothetical protein